VKLAQLLLANALLLVVAIELFAWQRFGRSGSNQLLPYDSSDQAMPGEFYFSRLRYNSGYGGGPGFRGFRAGWSQDFPRADHDCLVALRRLTRIDSPSPLSVVDVDDDHMLDFPWIYAVGVANWAFTDAEAQRLRDYIERGGFLMVDHFHGPADWNRFMSGMNMVLPNAVIEDIPDDDPIFHDLYNIQEKFQIPGEQYVATGRTYEKDGYIPGWRCIRDKKGRIVVAICFNMHLCDAWEWADDGGYPEKFSTLAFRIVLNYITYAMSH
jgi:Domain of unknown function (DUF4159)